MFTPEHIHVMINHLPIIGIGLAIIPFLIGIIKKNRDFILMGLIIAFVSAISVPMVMASGAKAEENLKQSLAILDNVNPNVNIQTKEWIEEHEDQAKIAMIPNYVLILITIFALMFFKNDNKTSKILNYLASIFVIIAFVMNGWVGASGGKIRHNEFREPAPKSSEPMQIQNHQENEKH